MKEIGLLSSVLCSTRNTKAVSFQPRGVFLLACVCVAVMWLSSWQSAAALAARLLWQATDCNHQISAFPAVTQNNFNSTLLFNYLELIPIPGAWWYSFYVSKHIFMSSLFIVLATLYLCAFTVLLEILLCEISSAVIISGECLSLAFGRLQHFHVLLRINVCPASDKPTAGACCTCMATCRVHVHVLYVAFFLKELQEQHPT